MSSKARKSHPLGCGKLSATCDWWPVPKGSLVPPFCRDKEDTQCIFCTETGDGFCCLASTLLFKLKSFDCGHPSIKGSNDNLFEHSPATLTSALSRHGCYLLHWAMPSLHARLRGFQVSSARGPSFQGVKSPHTFLSGLISLGKTAGKIKQTLHFSESFRLKTRCPALPCSFLYPSLGRKVKQGGGQSSIPTASVPWLHRWQEGTCDVSF